MGIGKHFHNMNYEQIRYNLSMRKITYLNYVKKKVTLTMFMKMSCINIKKAERITIKVFY